MSAAVEGSVVSLRPTRLAVPLAPSSMASRTRMSVSSSCAPATVTANQSSRHCLVRSTRSSGKSRQARAVARLAISAVTATISSSRSVESGSFRQLSAAVHWRRPLRLSRHDMEDVPVLGIAARRDAVGFLLLEHLDLETVEHGLGLVSLQEGHAGATVPGI